MDLLVQNKTFFISRALDKQLLMKDSLEKAIMPKSFKMRYFA